MKNYTLQFHYNGKDYSYPIHSEHEYKPTMNLRDVAENIVESILDREEMRVENGIVQHLCLFTKEGEPLWNSDEG